MTMVKGHFEPEFPSPLAWLFHGEIYTEVTDPHGQPASTIIAMEDDFHLKVTWQLHGKLVPAMSGQWHVNIFLESIGSGTEVNIRLNSYSMGLDSYTMVYPIDPMKHYLNLTPGPYKLVTVLTSTDNRNPSKPLPFAAYVESPMLQFYRGESVEGKAMPLKAVEAEKS